MFVDLCAEVNKYKQNPTECSSALWSSYRAVGHSEKILLTGHCSMAWFVIEKNSQAQRQCCHHAELGIAGVCILCISSLEQMEKGQFVCFKSQEFRGAVHILETASKAWTVLSSALFVPEVLLGSEVLRSSEGASDCTESHSLFSCSQWQ